jgi:hypothetical protein
LWAAGAVQHKIEGLKSWRIWMSASDDSGPALPGHAAEKPEGTTPASDRKENPLRNGSAWGRRALDGIRQLHQDEEARKEVARRLF